MKKHKKLLSRICALALVIVMLTAFFALYSTKEAAEALSLPVIEELKGTLSPSRPFRILEISSGAVGYKISYLTDVPAAQNYAAVIAGTEAHSTAAERKLAHKIAIGAVNAEIPSGMSLVGADPNVYPYDVIAYEEFYFWEKNATERAALTALTLPAPESVNVLATATANLGAGMYDTEYAYSLANPTDSGTFTISGGSVAPWSSGTEPGFYYALDASNFVNLDLADSAALPADANPAIYRHSVSGDDSSPFVWVADWPSIQAIVDECTIDGTFDEASFRANYFYLDGLSDVIPTESGSALVINPAGGLHAYRLNDGSYEFTPKVGGCITASPTSDFTLNESGTGNFDLAVGSGDSATITTQTVWYSGGFVSHDWFSRFVLDQKAGDAKIDYSVTQYSDIELDTLAKREAIDYASFDLVVVPSAFSSTRLTAAINDPKNPLPVIRTGSGGSTKVDKSVYDIGSAVLLSPDFNTAFPNASITAANGLKDVLDAIVYENFLRSVSGVTEKLDEVVSIATTIRHIINYGGQRTPTRLEQLRVLEVQPTTIDEAKAPGSYMVEDFIMKWLPAYRDAANPSKSAVPLSVTRMTMAEFNGRIEDLSENYDLIFFGDVVGGGAALMPPFDSSESAIYNGLIYYNIGPKTAIGIPAYKYAPAGLLPTDWSGGTVGAGNINKSSPSTYTYRYSGNDISTRRLAALRDFADAGYPIVFGNNLVNLDPSGTRAVNTASVDNCTRIYEFMTQYLPRDNTFTDDSLKDGATDYAATQARLKLHLELSKPTLELLAFPEPYTDRDSANKNGTSLLYRFKISNISDPMPAMTTYNVHLYVDENASGIFTADEEISFDVYGDGKLLSQELGSSGTRIYKLSADTEYSLVANLDEDRVGIIPWKISVDKNVDAAGFYAAHGSASGFTRFAPSDDDAKIELNVLQIVGQGMYTSGGAIGNGNPPSLGLNSTLIIEQDSQIIALLDALNDFNVSLNTIGANGMHVASYSREVSYNNATNNLQNLTANPLLIPGIPNEAPFKDDEENWLARYSTNTEEEVRMWDDSTAPQVIYEKLALFDMLILGFADAYNGIGDNLAQALELFIADGKSVLFSHDAASFFNSPYSEINNIRNTVSLESEHWGFEFNRTLRGLIGLDYYGVMGATEYTTSAYVPKSGLSQPEPLIQGLTAPFMTRSNHIQYAADYVAQINTGQITTYPYNVNVNGMPHALPSTTNNFLRIAETHSQYYTLNTNIDDLVVWYTLEPQSASSAINERDPINNYYIYTMGNVTYSGVGHKAGLETEEAKLFVNTIIAAYRSNRRNPIVTVRNKYGSSAELMYFTGDAGGGIMNAEPESELYASYFSFSSPLADGKFSVKYEYSLGETNHSLGAAERIAFNSKTVRYDIENQRIIADTNVTSLESSHQLPHVYRFYIPPEVVAYLSTDGNVVTIYVTVTYTSTTDPLDTLSGTDILKLRKIGLLELR